MKKKLLAIFLVLTMSFSLVACGDGVMETAASDPGPVENEAARQVEEGSWSIYWYLCGSDLESSGGFASTDLGELMEVELPENGIWEDDRDGAAHGTNHVTLLD